jgi:other hect domain ubiquitin protein ligase E3
MGMAVRTGVMLNVDFPSFFWKPLVNQSLGIRDLRDIDFSFFGFLKFIRSCDQSSLEGPEKSIFEKFIIPLSDKTEVLLKPSGDKLEVSYSNRDEYLELAEKARLHESALQLREIRRGLGEVLPLPLLELCTWQDLEWRVCGRPTIDIKLLKRHTTYSGIQANASHIKFFWNVLKSFSQEDRRAFVRFAWAQERLPADDQEFERTMTRMLIKPFTGYVVFFISPSIFLSEG